MATYLVGNIGDGSSELDARDFLFVNAYSEAQAIEKFVLYCEIGDSRFQEYVYDKSVNMSFAETFFLEASEETEHFESTGEVIINDATFKERVEKFFADKLEYAALYIQYYFGDKAYSKELLFPDDMLLYIWLNSSWATLRVIDVADITTI